MYVLSFYKYEYNCIGMCLLWVIFPVSITLMRFSTHLPTTEIIEEENPSLSPLGPRKQAH